MDMELTNNKARFLKFSELYDMTIYGVNSNGDYVFVDTCENGLACNLFCIYCHSRLVARNNEKNIRKPHFAHEKNSQCRKGHEATLPIMAKKIIEENGYFAVPHGDISFGKDYYFKSSKINVKSVEVLFEDNEDTNVPDLLIETKGGSKFILSIFFEKKTSDAKTAYLVSKYKNVLTIDLSDYKGRDTLVWDTLEEELFDLNSYHKNWLKLEKEVLLKRKIKDISLYHEVISTSHRKKFVYCPKDEKYGKAISYLDALEKCDQCKFYSNYIVNSRSIKGCVGYLSELNENEIMNANKDDVVIKDSVPEDEINDLPQYSQETYRPTINHNITINKNELNGCTTLKGIRKANPNIGIAVVYNVIDKKYYQIDFQDIRDPHLFFGYEYDVSKKEASSGFMMLENEAVDCWKLYNN